MSDRPKNYVGISLLALAILAVCFTAGYLLIPRQPPAPPVPPVVATGPETGPVEVATTPALHPGMVYQLDFTNSPGEEWNRSEIAYTKKGDRPYLGDFLPGSKPALTLKPLPPHKLIRLTFDLFLMKSWDGSSPIWGPGLFDVNVGGDDGRSLVHATFSNCGFFSDNNEQSFPDNYPSRPYEAWTLAAERQTLGTQVSWGGPERTFDTSGVYHLAFAFPHTASEAVVEFQSTLPDNPNKPFGLTNIKVEALPELAAFTAAEFDQLWSDLGSADPKLFYDARWKLVSAGDAATAYIGKHYKDLPIPANPFIKTPGGTVLPYAMEVPVIHRERARWVLEAIHTPAALALKIEIPTVVK